MRRTTEKETMPLPKAIQEQADAADAYAAHLAREQQPLAVDPHTGEALTPPAPVVAQADPKPATAPAPNEFEQKYRSIQGKYDVEVPILRNQARTFEQINASLSAQLAAATEELQRSRATPVPAVQAEPVRAADAKDVETFGSDLVDLINRVSHAHTVSLEQRISALLTEVRGAVAKTNSDVGSVKVSQAQTHRELYDQRLTDAVPNWREVNASQSWLAWLSEFDPLLGASRQAALNEAWAKFDSGRTIAFLSQYLTQARATETEAPLTPQEELARQVSPRSTQANPSAPDANSGVQKTFTQKEIGDFYTAVLQGKWKADPAGKARTEKEIDEAVAAGRVR